MLSPGIPGLGLRTAVGWDEDEVIFVSATQHYRFQSFHLLTSM